MTSGRLRRRDSFETQHWPAPMVWPPQVHYEAILVLESAAPLEGEGPAEGALAAPEGAEAPPKCESGEIGEIVRRALADSAVADGGAWHAEWTRRFSCWWISLPRLSQSQLGSCMGALGLHVGSRLEAAAAASQLRLGTSAPAAQSEPGCEWLEGASLQLPAFPAFPRSDASFTLPPIPRLMPSWQRLQSLAEQRHHAQLEPQQEDSSLSHLGIGAAAGFGLGAALVLGLAAWQGRGRSARLQLRRGNAEGAKAATT